MYNRRAKKYRFLASFALLAGFFFGVGATSRIVPEMLCLPYAGFFFFTLLIFFLHIFEHLKQNVFFPDFSGFLKISFLIIKFFGFFLVFFQSY